MFIIKTDGLYWTGSTWSRSLNTAKRYYSVAMARRVTHSVRLEGQPVGIYELSYNIHNDTFTETKITFSGLPESSERAFLSRLERARREGDRDVIKEMETKYHKLFA